MVDAGNVSAARVLCSEALAPLTPATTIRFPMREPVLAHYEGPVVPPADVTTRLRIAWRDGFVDRYSPERWQLVNPGALRVLNLLVGRRRAPHTAE